MPNCDKENIPPKYMKRKSSKLSSEERKTLKYIISKSGKTCLYFASAPLLREILNI